MLRNNFLRLQSSTSGAIARRVACNAVLGGGSGAVASSFITVTPSSTSNNIWSSSSPIQFAGIRHGYGFGKAQRGHQRLSYEEKMARRMPKSKEEKRDAEKRQLESENYIDVELPDGCAADQERIVGKAEAQLKKLLHPAQALFDVEVEIHGQKKPLSQLATIVKVAGREYEIVPNNSAFTSPILIRLPRYDSALNAHKEGDKIKVTMPQMTRAKRVAVADYIKDLASKTKPHFQAVRRNAINFIEDLSLPEDVTRMRSGEAEEIVKKCEADLVKQLEDMAQEVLLAGNDEDENDGTVV